MKTQLSASYGIVDGKPLTAEEYQRLMYRYHKQPRKKSTASAPSPKPFSVLRTA